MTSDAVYERKMTQLAEATDEALEALMGEALAGAPEPLREAMFYAVFPGGKRIRPALLLEACRLCGGDLRAGLPAACAVELVHCYSLVHDDLPCMDDAKERRGKPALHVAFGEAVAVLAGDALLTLAFESLGRELGRPDLDPQLAEGLRVTMLLLARSSGAAGMVGGQAEELSGKTAGREEEAGRRRFSAATGKPRTASSLERIIVRKTGALFEFSLRAGALLGGLRPEWVDPLANFGRHLGAVFQVADDLSDFSEDACSLVTVFGADAARQYGLSQADLASKALDAVGAEASFFRWILEQLAGKLV